MFLRIKKERDKYRSIKLNDKTGVHSEWKNEKEKKKKRKETKLEEKLQKKKKRKKMDFTGIDGFT